MILGKMEEVSGPYGIETTCSPIEEADLEIQLSEAIKHIQGTMTPALDRESELDEMIESIPADPNVRNYSFTAVSYTHLDVYKRQVNGIGKGVEIDNWAARLCAWV